MRKARLCLVFPLCGMFTCSMIWLYLQAQLVEKPELESPLFLNKPSQSDWDLFLSRRNIEIPGLVGSVTPWNLIEPINSTVFTDPNYPLTEIPDLSSNSNVSCILRKFGFTRSQASEVYNSNKRLRPCGDGRYSFLKVINNKLVLDCAGARWAEFAVGQDPSEELLGDVEFPRNWASYTGPVSMGNSEFAFVRCGKTKREAILMNKFNATIAEKSRNTTERIREELGLEKPPRPLSVYLIMFDSLARQHFYRNFPETIEFLNSTMGPNGKLSEDYSLYDFAINNAHGENTQPNMVPFLLGYDVKYHKVRLQDFSIHHPEDVWKYDELQQEVLWKHFKDHGFVTLFGYDTVWDSFSHSFGRAMKTDHMVSNFYHAGKRLAGYMDYQDKERCIGTQNAHNYALNYITQFNANYKGHSRFVYQHLSTGHDKSGIVIRTADSDTKRFLESILAEQMTHENEDFVIFVASDHGKHSNEWDKTYEGFLENQLPLHLAIVSKGLITRLNLHDTLKHNSKRLVTRLDWHITFRHLATLPYGQLHKNSSLYQAWKQQTDSPKALSLFMEKVPDERDCEDLTVPLHYCSCKEYLDMAKENALKMPVVLALMQLGLRFINSVLIMDNADEVCSRLSSPELIKSGFQLLGEEQSVNRNFKIRVSVGENRNAKFDFIGMMVAEDSVEMLRPEGVVSNSTFVTGNGEEYKVLLQLVDIFRVDEYAGVCESLAIAASTKPSFCVCKIPFPNSEFTYFQTSAIDKLLSKLQMAIATKGRNCHLTCIDLGKSCHPWAITLINDERVLLQPWLNSTQGFDYLNMTSKETNKMKNLRIDEWTRDGRVIKLRAEKNNRWVGVLALWSKGASCDDQPKTDYAICPCN